MRHFIFLGLLASPLALAEPGTLLRDSSLLAKPAASATVVSQLPAQSSVDITARQGAWANVKTPDGKSGWVRVLNVRTGSGQRGDAGIGAVASVFKTGSSGNTVSTGVKGLSAEELAAATPNPAEAAKLEPLMVDDTRARQFATQGKLAAQTLEFLPTPEPEPTKKKGRK
ncbi:MAG: SH3 domain-containing protein [Moraxellaceae bacterium]|nr:SH3 domain-containing protein [Moraxellaceae bacterium]